jgi:hypothetical protein
MHRLLGIRYSCRNSVHRTAEPRRRACTAPCTRAGGAGMEFQYVEYENRAARSGKSKWMTSPPACWVPRCPGHPTPTPGIATDVASRYPLQSTSARAAVPCSARLHAATHLRTCQCAWRTAAAAVQSAHLAVAQLCVRRTAAATVRAMHRRRGHRCSSSLICAFWSSPSGAPYHHPSIMGPWMLASLK